MLYQWRRVPQVNMIGYTFGIAYHTRRPVLGSFLFPTFHPTNLPTYLPPSLPIDPSVPHLPTDPSSLPTYLPTYLPTFLPTYPPTWSGVTRRRGATTNPSAASTATTQGSRSWYASSS